MALTKEEVVELARCKANCVMAGMLFAETVARDIRYAPTVTPMTVAGLVPEHDLIVPHSELAMHVGAAGKKLIAWALREDGREAVIVFDNEAKCCGYTHGLPTEVITPGLVRVTKDLLHIKEA